MLAKILISLMAGVISSVIYDRLDSGASIWTIFSSPPPQRTNSRPKWGLILLSVIPGFFVGAALAGICESYGKLG